jgi:hypothetical protein
LHRLKQLNLKNNQNAALDANSFTDLRALNELLICKNQYISHDGKQISNEQFKSFLNDLRNKPINIVFW